MNGLTDSQKIIQMSNVQQLIVRSERNICQHFINFPNTKKKLYNLINNNTFFITSK